MPEMKLGKNFVTGQYWFLTSWKSMDDPAKGEFSLRVDTHGLPQQVSMKRDKIKTRGGPWNGLSFSGYPWLRPDPIFEYEFVLNGTDVYYEYTLVIFTHQVFGDASYGGIGHTAGRSTLHPRYISVKIMPTVMHMQCQ